MAKIPYFSPIVQYRFNGIEYEAEKILTYVIVRDAAVCVSANRWKDVVEANESLERKMKRCPFMVLCDGARSIAISVSEVFKDWRADDHPLIESYGFVCEEQVVLVNLNASIMQYEKDAVGFSFRQGEQLFCKTMCLPLKVCTDLSWVEGLQRHRDKVISDQLKASRIVLGDSGSYTMYNGSDFTLMGRL